MSEYNYVCTLDTKYEKKAMDELFEVPSDRLDAVQAFRDWIKCQDHIKCPETDTLFLLTFLRWAKWSHVRAREKFQGFLSMGQAFPATFKDIDTTEKELEDVMRAGYLISPSKITPNGEHVVILNMGALDKLPHPMNSFFRLGNAYLIHAFYNEMNQVNGYVFICDYSEMTARGMKKIMTMEYQKIVKCFVDGFPGRWKKVCYYRAGVLFETIMTLLRPALPKKINERTSCHDSMATIYPHVPMECLPVEYLPDDYKGPHCGSIEDLKRDLQTTLQEKRFREKLKYLTSSAFGIDEKKKPSIQSVNTHFRKMNVD